MKYRSHLAVIALSLLLATINIGCGTKIARSVEKQVMLTKDGIVDTKTNIEEGLSHVCQQAPAVSSNADEVLRLTSSEEQTLFIVDGKEMGRAKQLKVCIDSGAEHTITAEPPGCEAKIEKLKPPYDFPIYEFRFMMAECKSADTQPLVAPKKPNIEISKTTAKTKTK